MKSIDLTILKGAIFSDDRKYRYALWRVWSARKPPLLFIGLNPSTANEVTADPTITRCMVRATRAGFGGLLMANLYAYVSSNPEVLLRDGDYIGGDNDVYLNQMIGLAGRVVCAWGSFPAANVRAAAVLKLIAEPYCLEVNRDGQPRHSLYVAYDIPITPYPR